MSVTIIGDVHGKYDDYFNIVNTCEASIQLGDFGFFPTWKRLSYSGLDKSLHKIIPGNHDDYDYCPRSEYCLGDFGPAIVNGFEFFFVRGGLSIDRVYRVAEELSATKSKFDLNKNKTWWSQEELNLSQMLECIDLYSEIKPDYLLSHAPTIEVIDLLHSKDNSILQKFKFHKGYRENTSLLISKLIKIHRPKFCFSGHHHKDAIFNIDGTTFISLAELSSFKIE